MWSFQPIHRLSGKASTIVLSLECDGKFVLLRVLPPRNADIVAENSLLTGALRWSRHVRFWHDCVKHSNRLEFLSQIHLSSTDISGSDSVHRKLERFDDNERLLPREWWEMLRQLKMSGTEVGITHRKFDLYFDYLWLLLFLLTSAPCRKALLPPLISFINFHNFQISRERRISKLFISPILNLIAPSCSPS